jgi:hypothetical protein
MIDMASVYAERFKSNPNALRAAVMGQSPDPKLDPYTALNALRLVKESQMAQMAGQAQQPTSAPSILAQNLAPPAPPQGLAGMMPMGAPAGQMPQGMPQGMPQRAPQAPVMQAASGGLASLPTADEDYCGGGIVAFGIGGSTEEDEYQGETTDTGYSDSQGRSIDAEGNLIDDTDVDTGTGGQRTQASRNVQQSRAALMGMQDEGLSQEDFNRIRQDSLNFSQKNAGPNIYDPANQRLKEREEARGKNVSQGQGLALLAAAGAILEGNTLARGASKAFPVFAQQMGEVQRADIAEQRSIESMQFSLADAQRKERMGDIRGAQAAAETARKEKADANRFKLEKAKALTKLDADVYKAANRPDKGAGYGPKLAEQLAAAELAYAKNPTKENRADVDALTRAAAKTRTSFSTGESGPNRLGAQQEALASKENIEANKALDKHKLMQGREWRKSVEAAGSVEAAEKQFKSKWITNNPQSAEAAPVKSTAAPTATSKVISMADVDATVAASGKSKQEVMDAIKAKGYTVK